MPKAAAKAREAASKAEASKLEAEQAAKLASEAVEAADAAVQSTTQQLEEAKAACAEGGCEEGTFWWLDREFEEQMKYMGPKQKAKALEARTASRRVNGRRGDGVASRVWGWRGDSVAATAWRARRVAAAARPPP